MCKEEKGATVYGKCRLCRLDRELRYSHILPEFLYKGTYDENHQAVKVSLENVMKSGLRKGLREYLLCAGCENLLNRQYEDYFAREWWLRRPHEPDPSLVIYGLDPTRFHLFHLSILWRASVCSRSEFSQVNLGPVHEEKLRRLLLDPDASALEQYPLMAAGLAWNRDGKFDDSVLMTPERSKIDSHTFYFTIYAGCAWYHCISSNAPKQLRLTSLREDGSLSLPRCYLDEFGPVLKAAPIFRQAQAKELARIAGKAKDEVAQRPFRDPTTR